MDNQIDRRGFFGALAGALGLTAVKEKSNRGAKVLWPTTKGHVSFTVPAGMVCKYNGYYISPDGMTLKITKVFECGTFAAKVVS